MTSTKDEYMEITAAPNQFKAARIQFAAEGEIPVVSICIITYNHEKWIRQAIESVLMQETEFPCEVIIADDCSTDSTRDIIRSYSDQYPLKLIFQETNKGPAGNWKDLLEKPIGKYIAYFEGDDCWIDNQKLTKQLSVLESDENIAFCYSNARIIDTKNPASVLYYREDNKPPVLRDANAIIREFGAPSCTFFFRNVIHPLPEWFFLMKGGDYVLMTILCKYGKAYYIDECLGQYNYHYTGVSATVSHIKFLVNDFLLWLNVNTYFGDDEGIWESIVIKGHKDIDKVFHRGSPQEARKLFWQWPLRKVFKVKSMRVAVLKMAVKLHFPFVSLARRNNRHFHANS